MLRPERWCPTPPPNWHSSPSYASVANCAAGWEREQHSLTQLRSRPSLADPLRLVTDRAAEVTRALAAARRDVIRRGRQDRSGRTSRGAAVHVGPAATLARGYAVVQTVDETGAARPGSALDGRRARGTALRIRLADGAIGA